MARKKAAKITVAEALENKASAYRLYDSIPPKLRDTIVKQWQDMAIRPVGVINMLAGEGVDVSAVDRMDVVDWIGAELTVRGAK